MTTQLPGGGAGLLPELDAQPGWSADLDSLSIALRQVRAANGGAGYPATAEAAAAEVTEPAMLPIRGARRERGRALKGALTAIGLVLALAVTAIAAAYLTFPHAAVFHRLPVAAPDGLVAAGALGAIIAAVAAWRAARRLLHGSKSANVLTVLAATVATIVSATGMWAFFAAYVPTIPVLVRIPIFAFLELSTVAEALRARDNMREFGSSGIDGLAMWVLTGTSAFLASLASSSVAEALFRLAPPLVAAWLWERALVSERRRRADRGQREEITSRISPKRILVRLGLAEPAGQTLGEAAAQRRIMVLALAAEAVAALEDAGAGPGDRRHQRAERRLRAALRQAVELADLAGNRDRQAALVSQLRILRSPHDLVTLDAESPWAQLAGPPRRPRPQGPPRKRPHDRGDRQDDRERNPDPGGGALSQLAGLLVHAVRQQDAAAVHELLAGRDDHAALVRWLGHNPGFGTKRVMAVTALYAVPGAATSPAKATAWIASIVPGKPGAVDKKEIRLMRDLLAPEWTARNYPAPATAGAGEE